MILSQEEILEVVNNPINPVIGVNRELQDDHKVHIKGTGFETVLKQIIGYENVEQFNQKKLLTKPFTRPIFKKIINSQSRWKTAQGTSKFYKFTKEKLAADFKDNILSQVWKGGSIDEFVKNFLAKAIYEEFNGFFLVEKGKTETIEGKKYEVKEGIKRRINPEEKIKPYIAFISVDDVYNYKVNGKRVEWICLKFGKEKRNNIDIELFRFIDDEFDYIIEKEGKVVRVSEKYPVLKHEAGRCPVVNVSFLNKNLTDDRTKTSPVDDIIALLDYYLHQFAEHLVTEVLHAHPNYYQVGQKCTAEYHNTKCDGGTIFYEENGEAKSMVCNSCKGTGHNLKKDASTTIILPALDSEGKAFSISNVAGYVAPPVDALTYQQAAIDWMENKILEAALNVKGYAQKEGLVSTATEVVANLRPLEDIISDIIDLIEGVEKELTDLIGRTYYGDKYLGCEIIYGRKLNLRDENTLLKEITEAKKAGATYQYIKTLCEELVYTRFIRSESDLQRNILLIELEPLVGFTMDEVEKSAYITRNVKILKQNFTDLIQKFEMDNGLITDYRPELETRKKALEILAVLYSYILDEQEEQQIPTI
jgi:hypothetical protein